MKIVYKNSFVRDIKKISDKTIVEKLNTVIDNISFAKNILDILEIKKITGFQSCFRIRAGDYRLGIYLENSVFYLVRFLPRKDFYKKFP